MWSEESMNHARIRYLESKRSVDRRSRSHRVAASLLNSLPEDPVIGEVGTGIGATVAWLARHGVTDGFYRGIDLSPQVIAHARDARPPELRYQGHNTTSTDVGGTVGDLEFGFETGDALQDLGARQYDVIVAQQFMDLVSLVPATDTLTTAAKPGALVYCPLTFDGVTVFQPDHPADERVEQAYHDAIERESDRDTSAGRHLLEEFRTRPGSICAVDASDAVVHPRNGQYPADESYFLNCILNFVSESVSVDVIPDIDEWLSVRRGQLADGRLSYIGHRYDLLYQTSQRDS